LGDGYDGLYVRAGGRAAPASRLNAGVAPIVASVLVGTHLEAFCLIGLTAETGGVSFDSVNGWNLARAEIHAARRSAAFANV